MVFRPTRRKRSAFWQCNQYEQKAKPQRLQRKNVHFNPGILLAFDKRRGTHNSEYTKQRYTAPVDQSTYLSMTLLLFILMTIP